jgi:putative ABC transport system permease protein
MTHEMTKLVDLDLTRMSLAMGLMAIAIGLSLWGQLGLTKNLAIATVRSVVQLAVVGYLLDAVFDLKQPLPVLGLILLMSVLASLEAKNRIQVKIKYVLPLVWLAVAVGSGVSLVYTSLLVIHPETWYSPQYLIPLAGMILGNAMNGAAIAAERLTGKISERSSEIETHLCLGATPFQAIAAYQKEAVKAAMIPTINAMMVVGVVVLPGTMTGQILAGVSPLLATRYQLAILFAITTANLITAMLATHLLSLQFFTKADQLKPL